MAGFEVSADPRDIARVRELLDPKQYRQALYQAVSRTTRKVSVQLKKRIKEKLYVKAKYLNDAIGVKVEKGDNPTGIITVRKKPIRAIAFKVRVSKRTGVTVKLGPGIPDRVFRHGFKATVTKAGEDGVHEGHDGIFLRTRHLPTKGPNRGKGKLTPEGFAGRLSIKQVMGIPIIKVVNVPDMIRLVRLDAVAEMRVQLKSQLKRFGVGAHRVLPSDPSSPP